MFKKIIRRIVSSEINTRYDNQNEKSVPPSGYNPLEEIRGGLYHWVLVPFNRHRVWCKLRCLNATQIDACGSFTMVDLKTSGFKPSMSDLIEMRNSQEKLIAAVMVSPSFDDVINDMIEVDFIIQKKRAELDEIKKIDLSSLPKEQIKEINEKIEKLELFLGFLLPEDTFGFLTSWALGADVSDIKRLSRDKLLEAAILAVNGHNDPHNHINGSFTDRDVTDIDKASWSVYAEYKRDKEIEKDSKVRWVRSGKKE